MADPGNSVGRRWAHLVESATLLVERSGVVQPLARAGHHAAEALGERVSSLLSPGSGASNWNPAAYEWYFTRTPLGNALRARDEALIEGALSEVLSPDQAVLEVGAGTGNYTVRLARRTRRVVALEPSPEMLAHLEERLEREGLTQVETGVGRLPGELGQGERFDGVLCLGVLNYVEDLRGSVTAMADLVAPGGWLLASVAPPTLEGRIHQLVEIPMRRSVHLHHPGALSAEAERAGLAVVRAGSAGITSGGITHLVVARRPGGGQSSQ